MNKALAFTKLDVITIKPYLTIKNFIFLIAMMSIMSFTTGSGTINVGIIMTMAIGAIYVSYPFVVGEKCNIDVLYATLSIKRKTVVLGRYLFALFVNLMGGLIAFALAFTIDMIRHEEVDLTASLIMLLVLYAAYCILISIQLPLYFKFGYTKAKFLVYIPLVVMPLLVVLIAQNLPKFFQLSAIESYFNWLIANPVYTAVFGFAVWLTVMMFSYGISVKIYNKRDF